MAHQEGETAILTPQEQEAKARFQFRGKVTTVLEVFNVYGLDVYNKEGAITRQIETLALQLHRRMNGEDIPIGIGYGE